MSAVETFERIIRHQSSKELVPFLLELPKADVIPVRHHTVKLKKELEAVVQLKANTWGSRITQPQSMMLFLSGLRTFSRKEALNNNFMGWWADLTKEPYFWQILEHTRPDWTLDWLQRWSSGNQWYRPSYRLLRQLEDRQLIPYDAKLFSASVPGVLSDICQPLCEVEPVPAQAGKVVARELSLDPVLLTRDFPLVFDFDSSIDFQNGSVQLTMDKKRWKSKEPLNWQTWEKMHPRQLITWLDIIGDLAETGHLDRADLLTRSLLALRRDFRRPLLTWFKNVFLTLKPTAAERLARQSELVELLAHPLPLVVNFALDQLKDLWAHSDFTPAPLLLYAEGLMTRQDLKTALRALLGAFDKLLKREPTLAPTLARLASSGLANADAGVQERAAKLLAGILGAKKPVLTSDEATEVTDTIGLYADLLTAAARTTLTPFLAVAPAAEFGEGGTASAYAPLNGFAPDISRATAIEPVQDWHELLFLTGQVVQHYEPAAVERWLDGLLRLHGQFPAGYAQQLRPYVQQALPWELKGKTEAEVTDILFRYSFDNSRNGQQQMLLALLMSWVLGFAQAKLPEVVLVSKHYNSPDPLLHLEKQRLTVVEARLREAASPLPLLSTPSHAPHWVAPSVLLGKLLTYEAAGHTPDPADLALALARTAWQAENDAATARQLLPQVQHPELSKLLSWLLAPADAVLPLTVPAVAGKSLVQVVAKTITRLSPFRQPAAVGPLTEAWPWLWAVAARTRQPNGTVAELRVLADYPGLAEPWSPGWQFEQKSNTYEQSWNKEKPVVTYTWQELCVVPEHPGQTPPSPLLLYSLHARLPQNKRSYLWSLLPDLSFLLTLLPNNPAPLHWHLVRSAFNTDNSGSESRDAMQKFLHPLLAPGPRFDESTTLLFALGLVHYAPMCRALALEVLLSSIDTARLEPAALGDALGQLLAAEYAPVQRLTDVLAQARAISPTTDDALRQLLDALLPGLPAVPLRNTRKLIEAYADLQGRTRQPVPAAVQQQLRQWSSSATLKKAAASLVSA
ncbi:DUF6493 family protein [Hymenobacter lucidus]|uniref:DUF6493 family protein n=1 Tax=Hymenobacter lucidus TaxID=2880930 RepID=A0ABS8AV45_9BACT|nr:DUF6493 family protein [Hymenobacter lucidus]MCB2409609.1 DUF6493 family protein [Hymenobacter lucidus]